MTTLRPSAVRPVLAVLLMLLLTLAGVGRGWAAASHATDSVASAPGVMTPICHAGRGSAPLSDLQHDCCDDCALSAAIALPDAPFLAAPASVEHFADHAAAVLWAPVLARARSPRLSQGPPTRVI